MYMELLELLVILLFLEILQLLVIYTWVALYIVMIQIETYQFIQKMYHYLILEQ